MTHRRQAGIRARLLKLADESCPEGIAEDCGPRCPKCCEMVEDLVVNARGWYICRSCGFAGSPRRLAAKLVSDGRIS